MTKLEQAIQFLKNLESQRIKNKQSRAKSCLGDVRAALSHVGLRIPSPMEKPNNTALANGHAMIKMPEFYGWEQIHSPLTDEPVLLYFKGCGILKDGRTAGHIAIKRGNKLYANITYNWNQWWADRVIGAFKIES